jgi:hypothetical protein
MTPFLIALEDQLRSAAERDVALAGHGPGGGRRRGFWSLIRLAPVVAVSVAVFVLAVVFLHHGPSHTQPSTSTLATPPGAALPVGAPAGPTHPLKGGAAGRIEQGSVKVAAEIRDLRGGLPWGLETFRTTDGQTCVLAGREQLGHVGVIGQDGTFNDDGRFHPFTRYMRSSYCAQTDGNGNAFITVSEPTATASGNDQDPAFGGCRLSSASAHAAHQKACPGVDERQLEYGLLGPDAASVTSIALAGRPSTVPTGPDGAFIVVGPRATASSGAAVSDRLMPGMVTAVTYRDGSSCQPRRPQPSRTDSRGCPPVGYLAPPHVPVTSADVRAPLTATLIHAQRWCANNSGHYIACDARVPAGYRVLPDTRGMVLLQWSWTAHVAASGSNAGYEYAITGGPPCGGGQSSSGPISARSGQRVVQQSLGGFACTQRQTISVEYRVNVGPGGPNFASPPDPGHDGQPFVGSTTIEVTR